MNRLFVVALVLASSVTLVAQTAAKSDTKAPEAVKAQPTKTVVSPANTVQSGPKGEVVKPKDITYGDSTIPGDSEVQTDLGNLNLLSARYQEELKDFQNKLNAKYQPEWEVLQVKIQKSVNKVKTANKWGDDVVFDANTKQWIKLAPSELKAIEKATGTKASTDQTKATDKK